MAQFRKRDGGNGVYGNDEPADDNIFRVLFDADERSNSLPEVNGYRGDDTSTDNKRSEDRVVDIFFVLFFLYVPEISCFKAKHGERVQKGDHGIYQTHFPILCSSFKLMGEIRSEKYIQQT